MLICVICRFLLPVPPNQPSFFLYFLSFFIHSKPEIPGSEGILVPSIASMLQPALRSCMASGCSAFCSYSGIQQLQPVQARSLGLVRVEPVEQGWPKRKTIHHDEDDQIIRIINRINIINITISINIGMMVGIRITDDNNQTMVVITMTMIKRIKKNNDDANHRKSWWWWWWWWWWVAPSQSEFNDIESMTDNDKTFHSWRTHSAFFTVMFSWPSKSKSACCANRAKPLCALWSLW